MSTGVRSIRIDALDTLFFRDGKSFTMGAETWADALFPPPPSVMYGALRNQYFGEHPKELPLANTPTDPTRHLAITAMALLKENTLLFPLPFDYVADKTTTERKGILLQRQESEIVSSCPAHIRTLFTARNDQSVKTESQGFLDGATLEYKFELHDSDVPKLSANSLELLQALKKRQKARLTALEAQCPASMVVRGTLDWRMVIGLGGAHVLETSMTLHHVYGIPYIPGSAVKGLVRHYFISEVLATDPEVPEASDEDLDTLDDVLICVDAAMLHELEQAKFDKKQKIKALNTLCHVKHEKTLEKAIEVWPLLQQGQTIFGTQHQRGVMMFLDALPEGDVQFQKDLMNPHYPDYYKEKKPVPPNDCQNPIPIPFLTLKKTTFDFPLLVNPLRVKETAKAGDPDDILKEVTAWLQAALEDQGIGAKSAVGYGYFTDLTDQSHVLQEQIEQVRLASLSPVEQLCEELRVLQAPNRSYIIYTEELPKFEADEQQQLVRALKTYWQSIGRWDVKPKKKKQYDKVQHLKTILGE